MLSRVILAVCPFVVLIRRSGRFLFLSGGGLFSFFRWHSKTVFSS